MADPRSDDHQDLEIAVIGLACRFPGSPSAGDFWRLVRGGGEAITFFSEGELAAAGVEPRLFRDPRYVPARGILTGVDLFDAPFFGISPREAERTDPQHRVFLECAWQALENAGYDPRRHGGLIGVFAAAGLSGYALSQLAADLDDLDVQVGNDKDHLPTRVAYKLDLRGPSLDVQTACSSSLVAVHLACQSLQFGECDLALAGGVWIVAPERSGYLYTAGGILAPDGCCRAFDARARGTVPGNGAGLVVLKRLPEALAEGDRVLAVIKGSAINNDGSSKVGYTAPSVSGQAAVIREALAVAGVMPDSLGYVEAHGTGTALGDPIEMAALARAFGADPAGGPDSRSAESRQRLAGSPAAGEARPPAPVPLEGAGGELLDAGARRRIADREARLLRRLDLEMPAAFPGLREKLDRLCAGHVHRFLAAAVELVPGASHGRKALRRRLRIVPRYRRFFELFLRLLEEDGVLRLEGETVRFLEGAAEDAEIRRLERQIRRQAPGFDALLRLLRRCAESYSRTLTGEIEAVEVLYPQPGRYLIEECERETVSHDSLQLYRQLQVRTLVDLVAAAPRKLRILEVGAGAGHLTWPLLEALDERRLLSPERLELQVTDVGRGLVERARQKAARLGFPAVRCRRLDIAADPAAQGLAPGSFDLVIGLNAVHVAPDVDRALGHLCSLLAAGGWLLLVEITRVERWHHLIYGLVPGWWQFEDAIRSRSLCLELQDWETVLGGHDVAEVLAFPRESARRATSSYGLILARKNPADAPGAGRRPPAPATPATPEAPEAPARPPESAAGGGACAIGSVKTNIGHVGVAAGIAGLIKTVLAVERGELPPSLHFNQPNPRIDFAASPFRVVTELEPWPAARVPRRAGVSSFGIGGTNAHVVVEQAPAVERTGGSRPQQLLVLSARTAAALDAATARLARRLRGGAIDLADAAYTLAVGRGAFEHRRALVADGAEDAAAALETRDPGRLASGRRPRQEPPVVLMFPGQGSQHAGMARALYDHEPTFRRELDLCSELLVPHLDRELRQLLYPASEQEPAASELLGSTAIAQPALFAVEYALARLWMEWGVRPRAMIGHSLGEYVAACLAGVFRLEDALALVAARGRLAERMPPGAMVGVALPAAEAAALCAGQLAVAAINGPRQTVISGPAAAVEALTERLAAEGVRHRRLRISRAFHSPLTESILETFRHEVARYDLSAPAVPCVSNLTGTWTTAEQAVDPAYWAEHLRATVRFADGLGTVLESEGAILLEVGPGRTLATLAGHHPTTVPAGRRLTSLPHPREDRPATASMLTSLGRLWLAGWPVDWAGYWRHERRRRVELPGYPFERRRYWLEPGRPAAGGPDPPPRDRSAAESGGARLYVPSWSRVPAIAAAGSAGTTLVFADDESFGCRVAERLALDGRRCRRIARGDRFERRADGTYTLDPGTPASYRRLIRQLLSGGEVPGEAVHLWSVSGDGSPPSSAGFEQQQEAGFYSLFWLAQAWEDAEPSDPLRLVAVSDGMHDVRGDEALRPEKATLSAACRVIPREYPWVSCRSIDVTLPELGGRHREAQLEALIRELGESREAVALRGGYRWLPGLVEVGRAGGDDSGRETGGVYLVTGGLEAFGFALARSLAREPGARLVLTAGSGPASRACRVSSLEELGAEVLVIEADATRRRQMDRVVAAAERRFGAMRGVLHAAGASGAGWLATGSESSRFDWQRRLRPTVQATLVLEQVLRGRELDFVLLASTLSRRRLGAGADAAGELFMDAFAQRQSRIGSVPWISLKWDLPAAGGRRPRGAGGTSAPAASEPDPAAVLERVLDAGLSGPVIVSCRRLERRIEKVERRADRSRETSAASAAPSYHGRPPGLGSAYVAPAGDRQRGVA